MPEATIVVFGVIIAFFAAINWRDYNNNKARAATAIHSIVEELSTNQLLLIEAVDYHSELLDTPYQNMTQIIGNFAYLEYNLVRECAEVLPILKTDSTSVELPQFYSYIPNR